MIPFERTRQQTIPNSSVKIIGVGGAGANMLDRIALDGMEGAELLAANTDMRTLNASVASEKIQLGRNLTKGLGSGGDPELGRKAGAEAELEMRDSLRDRKIVFVCVGLGGGTGSGAAPLVTRLAREEGAFTVVFATMPFPFEGQRRREQAETSLNELAVLANALVTFDNGRMGELVLAKQGVHEAFSAADRMVSESIKAVTRIVLRPGLVNIGLDDLVAALSNNRSRCLFGSGIATGENRALQALKNAMSSPLLDRGSLLNDAETVLVHLCGGEDMTLYEIELLMQGLSKHVPSTAQILFGTAVDPSMEDSLSVTLVSSLPEDRLHSSMGPETMERIAEVPPIAKAPIPTPTPTPPAPSFDDGQDFMVTDDLEEPVPAVPSVPLVEKREISKPEATPVKRAEPEVIEKKAPVMESAPEPKVAPVQEKPVAPKETASKKVADLPDLPKDPPATAKKKVTEPEDAPSKETRRIKLPPRREKAPEAADKPGPLAGIRDSEEPPIKLGAGQPTSFEPDPDEAATKVDFASIEPKESNRGVSKDTLEELQASVRARKKGPKDELALEGGPKGRFEGQDPNVVEGEDLDIPPFLRHKKG